MKRALITGIVGQDGSYLAEFLLKKGYEVHGVVRRSSSTNMWRIADIEDCLHLHEGDLLDGSSLTRIVFSVCPHEVYNLAAQSQVRASFAEADHTGNVTGLGAVRMLEAVRQGAPEARYYQAGSSEMFGSSPPPQSENTPFHPRSPYAASKAFAHYMTQNFREAYGLHASNGILFNHESIRRGETFVTRKISIAAARIKRGLQDKLYLGNLDARRDWGFAGDYIEAMWLMLQQEVPGDYVVATGKSHSIRDFLDIAFGYLDLDWQKYVEIDKKFFRPSEVDALCGDASKAKRVLGWEPKVLFKDLVISMVDSDMAWFSSGKKTS